MAEQQKFRSFFEEELNRAQQQAVKHHTGPLLVVAGAGSGKTRVITSRISHLILEEHVSPTSIVALTFTNKAAMEMKKRIRSFLDEHLILPFVGTFHSYCLQLLKTHPHLVSRPHFTILDEDDQHKIISKIITRFALGKKVSAKQLAYHISVLKNTKLPEHDGELPHHSIDSMVQQVYKAYEQEKELSNCFDFDDLLIEALKLFRTHKEFKESFQERIRHVLVDEYQDTNVTQHELLKQMALSSKKKFAIDSLCVVGDEDQSIYSWRGATVANIMNFKKDFPNPTVITIDQNYRSVQPILDTANQVIQHNQNRNPKTLWSDKKGSDRIRAFTCLSGYQEAELITTLLSLIEQKSDLSSVAILYRAHYQSRALEEALIKSSIPYRIIGGILFYERAEIKDTLAYLRLIVNPFDRVSFFRVINTPSRGLGEKFEELVYTLWNQESFMDFKQICRMLIEKELVTKSRKEAVEDFLEVFDGLTHSSQPSMAAEQIITRIGYLTHLKNSLEAEEARTKSENIKELLQAIKHFEEQGLKTISAFLDEVALMQEKTTKKDDGKAVQLMTLHAAKGLEFDTVFITGLEEGVLPSSRSVQEQELVEEERRLLYVGITRARERLILTQARYRHVFGQMEHQTPSRFWGEINKSALEHEDCSHWQHAHMREYGAKWLSVRQQISKPIITFSAPKRAISEPTVTMVPASGWMKNQPVRHNTFGVGIIKNVERKSEDTIYITAEFKLGTKKVDAKFLHKL